MANLRPSLSANKLAAEITITITHVQSFRLRVWLSKLMLGLARIVAPFDIVVNQDAGKPWLFHCPYCGREFNGAFVSCLSPFTVQCSHCMRQSFAKCDSLQAWIVEEPEPCEYACGYTEPYGFVPEAGCPIHDPEG